MHKGQHNGAKAVCESEHNLAAVSFFGGVSVHVTAGGGRGEKPFQTGTLVPGLGAAARWPADGQPALSHAILLSKLSFKRGWYFKPSVFPDEIFNTISAGLLKWNCLSTNLLSLATRKHTCKDIFNYIKNSQLPSTLIYVILLQVVRFEEKRMTDWIFEYHSEGFLRLISLSDSITLSEIIVRFFSIQYLKHCLAAGGFYLAVFYLLLVLELVAYSRCAAPLWTGHSL